MRRIRAAEVRRSARLGLSLHDLEVATVDRVGRMAAAIKHTRKLALSGEEAQQAWANWSSGAGHGRCVQMGADDGVREASRYGIEHLQQQRPKQPLRRNRRPPHSRV